MKYYIAVDGGGSKTKVLCADQDGNQVGEGLSGPTSLTATSIGAASFNLREGVRQATQEIPDDAQLVCLVMGLAGLDTPAEEEMAHRVFRDAVSHLKIQSFHLFNDIMIALESGSDNPNAVAIISGTGSNCFGRNEHGQTAKTGGLDFLLTDQGSGYNIGWHVLKAATKSFDGRGPKTVLETLICDFFHVTSIDQLKTVIYNPTLSKTEVAELSKLCHQAYDDGDVVARKIIEYEIGELVIMINTVVNKLQLQHSQFDCVCTGGIITIPHIRQPLTQKLHQSYQHVSIVFPEKDPVHGALKMALSFANFSE